MTYKEEFIKFMVDSGVLTFGEFTLKSGRKAPYFIKAKDHGEGGMFVGKKLTDGEKVVIIDDVMTSGKALGESMPKLKSAADVNVTGMVITVDRMEKALDTDFSAVQQAYKDFGVKVYSIVNINDIIKAIEDGVVEGKEYLDAMRAYRAQYGAEY